MGQSEFLDCEVAVIGASLAGSSFALALAPLSSSIALIDSAEFPRRKACGEGLSNHGLELLASLGVSTKHLPHQPLTGYEIYSANRSASIKLSTLADQPGCGIGISREQLDAAVLAQAAAAPSVSPLLQTRVMKCEPYSDYCKLSFADERVLRARFVVVASGAKHRFGAFPASHSHLTRFAYTQPFEVKSNDRLLEKVKIIVNKGFEIYVTPTGGRLLNVALLAPKKMFAALFSSNGKQYIHGLIEQRLKLKLSPIDTALPIGPLGNFRQAAVRGRMFFIGDACEQFDPIGGMGMTHALLSAKLAAQSLGDFLREELTFDEAARRYSELRYQYAKPLRGFTRLSYFMLVGLAFSGLSTNLASSGIARRVSRAVHRTDKELLTTLSRKFVALAGR